MVESDELNQHDEIPARVKPLLSEFADVFPTELPTGLQPIRSIEHQINLVPGSVLPNKAAYRCSPHEAKELEKQVTELVVKGRFIKDFSTLVVPITDCMKKGVFEWSSSAQSALESLKEKLSSAPILALPNFDMLFELECDPRQFVLFSDHEALKYINGQHKLNPRRYSLLSILEARVLGFSFVKELYEADPDFAPILNRSPAEFKRDYVEHDGFLFKGSRLCIPKDSIRELLIREAHGGGLASHFGVELPGETAVSSTFNVGDLMPYLEDDNLENLRSGWKNVEKVRSHMKCLNPIFWWEASMKKEGANTVIDSADHSF
ncbi:uncharacterized protein [Rutidosis leptorrhynchoides]|uniref:uncharacterized protein n=1 Tax=Rutidosis leptorrhynchoides TaxID=125765 RepID=UPI003A98DB5C